MTTTTPARDISSGPKRDIRFVTIEPGRISLHGVALTDGEYAVLRGIAERMKVRADDFYAQGGTQAGVDMQLVQQRLLKEIKQC